MATPGKIWRRIFIVIGFLLLLIAGSAYFIFRYHLKDLVEEFVLIESGYTYELKMSKFSFSLRGKHIRMKDARLTCLQKKPGETYYAATIPELYLSLDSWELLLKQRRVDIDSICITNSAFHVYSAARTDKEYMSDKPVADVLDVLNRVRHMLGIRSMNIEQTAVSIHSADRNKPPFKAEKINLRVRNFDERHAAGFLSAEDVSLTAGRQSWNFSNGSMLSFDRMFFSGKSQFFEIDSCFFTTAQGPNKGQISFSADKARWSSHRLADIYTNGEVILDTIFLAEPFIHFTIPEKKPDAMDTGVSLSSAMSRLFGDIKIKYIQVDQGKLSLESAGSNRSTYNSRSTDLIMEDLDINRDSLPHISVGKIDLRLNEVSLSTSDSQYVLNIGEFGLIDNNLICKEASFGPTFRNKVNTDFSIEIPSFVLNSVSLPDILQKRFKAASGVLINPDIVISPRPRYKDGITRGQRLNNLYHSLNGLAQLISVNDLSIRDGSLRINNSKDGRRPEMTFDRLNALIRLNQFLESEALLNMKKAVPDLTIAGITMQSSRARVTVRELELEGDKQKNYIKNLSVLTRSGIRILGEDLYWQQFDWDRAMNLSELEMDSVDAKSLLVEIEPAEKNTDNANIESQSKLSLYIRKLNISEIFLYMQKKNGVVVRSKISDVRFDSLFANDEDLTWKSLGARLEKPELRKGNLLLSASGMEIDTDQKFIFREVLYEKDNKRVTIPSMELSGTFRSLKSDRYDIHSLQLESPSVKIGKDAMLNAEAETKKSGFQKALLLRSLRVNNGNIDYSSESDSMALTAGFNLDGSSLQLDSNNDGRLLFDTLLFRLSDLKLDSRKLHARIPDFRSSLTGGSLSSRSRSLEVHSAAEFDWERVSLDPVLANASTLTLTQLAGTFRKQNFSFGSGNGLSVKDLMPFLQLKNARLEYGNSDFKVHMDSVRWNGEKAELITAGAMYQPLQSRESFFAGSKWQKDYFFMQSAGLRIIGLDTDLFFRDSALHVRELHLLSPVVNASRDKNIPFEHGKEKPMPTRLISSLPRPIRIDSILISNGTVHVNEVSGITGREGNVVISGIQASISQVASRPGFFDSLRLTARGQIFGNHIRSFKYRESYGDSLSGFRLSLRMSPMDLTRLSAVTNPLAAVNVERGHSDTLVARISGNKYASYGEMDFHYRDLKIKLLDKQDTSKKNFLLSFESLVANSLVLRSKNKKSSTVFFKRDREKFIFNYWIKSVFSGVMTGAGVKSNKKFEKEYKAVKDSYSLPGKKE